MLWRPFVPLHPGPAAACEVHMNWTGYILHVSAGLRGRWAYRAAGLSDHWYWPLDPSLNFGDMCERTNSVCHGRDTVLFGFRNHFIMSLRLSNFLPIPRPMPVGIGSNRSVLHKTLDWVFHLFCHRCFSFMLGRQGRGEEVTKSYTLRPLTV